MAGRPAPGAVAGPRVPRAARYSRSPTLAPREIAARGGRAEPEAVPVGGAPLFYFISLLDIYNISILFTVLIGILLHSFFNRAIDYHKITGVYQSLRKF